jgi:predicted ATPase
MTSLTASHYLLDIKLRRDRVPSFETYPYSLPAIKELGTLKLHPKVTFIVGENGSGKSTLLEAIATAWGFNPEGGTKNFNFGTRRSHSELHEALTLVKGIKRAKDGFFLRAESFFNVATEIESLGVGEFYGERPFHEQSHGESFFALMTNRFGGNGLYILDEPEAALSPARQLAMLVRMHELAGMNSQFIIATHSPILMAYPEADIYQIDESGLVRTAYEETENFLVTKAFLGNPTRQLALLLE